MTKKNILHIFLISLLILLSLSIVNATETNTQTKNMETHTITTQESPIQQSTDDIQSQQINNPKIKKTIETTSNQLTETSKNNHSTKNLKSKNSYIINNTNYDDYFDEDGFVLDNTLSHSTVTLTGEFKNKTFYIDTVPFNITGKNALLHDSTINIQLPSIKISNITFNNTNKNSAIVIEKENTIIENCNITYNTTNDVKAIYITGNNSTIINNNIHVGGPSDEIDWYSDPDLARTLSIAITSNNNKVLYNNITTYSTISKIPYGAIESITIQGAIHGDKAENNTVEYNNIITTGHDYVYGINLGQNINNNKINYNNITSHGLAFADSIQIFSAASNIQITYNNISSISQNISDGIAISKDNMVGETRNNTILFNRIEVDGNYSTAMDIGNIKDSQINHNKISITGQNINGIIIINGKNNTIHKNNIKLNSLKNEDVGILLKESTDNQITTNMILTNTTHTITLLGSNNNTIVNNTLISKRKAGDISINTTNTINTLDNNNHFKTRILLNNITTYRDMKVNLTCQVLDETNKTVHGGKVVLKINGKTLKDDNGNIIYLRVENGVAKLSNYTIPENWRKSEYTLTAVYGGYQHYLSNTNNSTITLLKENVTLTYTSQTTFKSNETIKLSVNVTHDNKTVNTGHVIFKINKKTLKDPSGNIIYATVENGIATITYTLPPMSSKIYNLTVVYGDSIYERCELNSKITIVN